MSASTEITHFSRLPHKTQSIQNSANNALSFSKVTGSDLDQSYCFPLAYVFHQNAGNTVANSWLLVILDIFLTLSNF